MLTTFLVATLLAADDPKPLGTTMTVYNDGFAVIREPVPLDLKAGVNGVRFAGVTAFVEPESVLLRDPSGDAPLRMLEQSYRADAASQQRLLELHEGKTIEFQPEDKDRPRFRGRIVRAGSDDGDGYSRRSEERPIVEVDGKLIFRLPGEPLFPSLGDDSILKPTLVWKLHADKPVKTTAQLSYVSGEVGWHADYNAVVHDKDAGPIELTGMVTIDNQSGKAFPNVEVKLVAGSVRKLPWPRRGRDESMGFGGGLGGGGGGFGGAPAVKQKPFDEYHLYSLPEPVALRDQETKQVEFLRANVGNNRKLFQLDSASPTWDDDDAGDFDEGKSLKVAVFREFVNSAANGLGAPLPKGRMRFHRRDVDGQLEFLGEGEINHTPTDRPVRVLTGHAFDLFGRRKRTDHRVVGNRTESESWEIVVGNRKKEPAEVHVVERFGPLSQWKIERKSHEFVKFDSQTIDFVVTVPPGGEVKVTYDVGYRWW
jgi:hypothetical protein